MTYNPFKPGQGKSPYLDMPIMQTNFSTYNNAFSANHIPMNSSNQGNHSTVIFQAQAAFPGLVVDSAVLFAKNAFSRAGTQPQLWVKIPLFLPNNIINSAMQLTYNTVNISGPQYQSFMIGGYLIEWGKLTANTSANFNQTITLTTPPTKLLVAIASSNFGFSFSTTINTTTNASFTITSPTNGGSPSVPCVFNWLIIGTV